MNGRPAPVPIRRYHEEPGISAVETESHRASFMWSHAFDERWVLRHRFKADRERVDGQRIEPGRVIDGRTLTRTARDRMHERETYFTTLDLTGEFTTGPFERRVLAGLDYYDTETVLGGAGGPYTPARKGPSVGSVSGPGSSPRTHGRATTPGPLSFPAMCGWISWPVMSGPSGVTGSPPISTSKTPSTRDISRAPSSSVPYRARRGHF